MKNEKKSKLRKLIPLVSSTIFLTGATAFLSGSCKNKEDKNKITKPNYQPAIKGQIKYLSIGDQYSTQYNENIGGYFDEKTKNIYGLSYSSYLANYINLLSDQNTYLKSYSNLGLSNSTLDEWLHLLDPKKYPITNKINQNFEYNKKLNQNTQINGKSKNETFFNNFKTNVNGKYSFLDEALRSANLLTMSLGMNDFLDTNEFLDIIWKLTYSNLSIEEAKKYFDKIFNNILAKRDSIIEKFNQLIKLIREKNPNVNINLVGYISPFLKFAKLIENKYTLNYLQIITDIINETIKKVASTHKINYLNFENQKYIMDNASKLTDGFLNSSINLMAHKKLAQDLIMKMALSTKDYETLISKKPNNSATSDYEFYKSLDFEMKSGLIKNTILGLSGNNIDSFKKEYEFEQYFYNKQIIDNNQKNKYNVDFLKNYEYLFNNGINYSNDEIISFIKNALQYFGIDFNKFKNIIDFVEKSLNDKNQKSNIINLINLVFNNRTINKLINQINYNVDEIFKSNHLENINTEEIFNLIVKMLSSSDTLYNILKEFFLSDFFKENIHEQWTLTFLNLFSKDILKSKLIEKLFNKDIAKIISNAIKDQDFFDSFVDYLNNIFKEIIIDRNILLNSKYLYEFSEKIILRLKDKFDILINKFAKIIKNDEKTLKQITTNIFASLSKIYHINKNDKEIIEYTIFNFIKNLDNFDKKTELILSIINSYLKLENNNQNPTFDDFMQDLINNIINPNSNTININHSLLFNILSYVPTNETNKDKYMDGLKKLAQYHIKLKAKATNFSDKEFIKNLTSLIKDILKNNDGLLNENGKNVIISSIKYITNNILDTKGLFYEIIKNISEYTILRPIINIIKNNNLQDTILKANPKYKDAESFVNDTFLQIYKVLGSNKFKTSLNNLFSHIINNGNLYSFDNYEEFILNVLKNAHNNDLKNLTSSILSEISEHANILPNVYSIFFIWFENETGIKLSKEERTDLMQYATNFIKNIPNSNFYENFFNMVTHIATSLNPNEITLKELLKLFSEKIKSHFSPSQNKKIIQDIFELIILKSKDKTVLSSFKEVLKTYKLLFGNEKFIDYLFEKIKIKQLILNYLNNININSLQIPSELKSELKNLLSDFSTFLNSKWETLFTQNLKELLIKTFSNENINDSSTIEQFISKALLNIKPILLNVLRDIFKEFVFNPLENRSNLISRFIVELSSSSTFLSSLSETQKELLAKTFQKLLTHINDKKIYESIISDLIDNLANNINEHSFNYGKYKLNILSVILKHFGLEKITDFVKTNLNSNEIRNTFEVLLKNIEYILDKIPSTNTEFDFPKIFNLIKVIFEKMDIEDKHLIINSYSNKLKSILNHDKISSLIKNEIIQKLNSLNKNLITEFLNLSKENSINSLIGQIFTNFWTKIINEQTIESIKEIINHIIDNYGLYASNNFEELFIKLLRNNKLNGLNNLLENVLKNVIENQEFNHTVVNLIIALIKHYSKIELNQNEIDKLYLYINLLIKNLSNSELFKKYFDLIMSNLETNTNDIQTLNKLSKFISTKSLDFLKNREIQEIFDFIQIKDKNNQYLYNLSACLDIFKILLTKDQFVDWILNSLKINQLISNQLENIKINKLRFNEISQKELKRLFAELSKFINDNYEEELKPLIKELINSAFASEVIQDVKNYKEWITKFLNYSKNSLINKLNNLFKKSLTNSQYKISEILSSFLTELMEYDLSGLTWTSEQKDKLKLSIEKLIKHLPKFNIFGNLIESLLANLQLNINNFGFEFKKYKLNELINLIDVINNLNYDEINKFIESMHNDEIRNLLLILLENITKFSKLINNSPSQSLITLKGNLNIDINKIFKVIKSLLSKLNEDDKNIIKQKLPNLFNWLKSDLNIENKIRNWLNNLKKLVDKDDITSNQYIDYLIPKIIDILKNDHSFEQFFNKLIESFICISNENLNKLNSFNDLFKYLIKTINIELKNLIKNVINKAISEDEFIDKTLDFIFNKIVKDYKIDTTSSQINNIKSLLKRIIAKINNLNFINDLTNDIIDLLPEINIFNKSGQFNSSNLNKQFNDIFKNIDYSKYLTSNNLSELIEVILNKNLPSIAIENELYSLYEFLSKNINKFNSKKPNNNSSTHENNIQTLRNIEKLLFNLLVAANGSIKPDNQNGKEGLVNFIFKLTKNEIEKLDFSSLNIPNISNKKLKSILLKMIQYPEIKSLIQSFVNDYLGGSKINANNLGQMMSKIIDLIKDNLMTNITNIIKKFANDDEILYEIIEQLTQYLSLENVNENDKMFLKNLINEIIPELLNIDIYKRKILNRLVKQLSKHANNFDILNPKLWLKHAIDEFKSALSFRDALVMANLIGENKVINGEKLVKLINLILGKSKNPDSLLYKALRNINNDKDESKRSNMKTLNDMIKNSIFSNPKPIGDQSDPDNILAPFDPLSTIDTIFKLLAKEIDNEASKIPNYYNSYKIRSQGEAYKASYRWIVTLQLALFEMFGRETLVSERDNVKWYQLTKVSLYSGIRSILWEIQEGTNLKSIPGVANKFSGMQRYYTNEKIRREFTNYVQKKNKNKYHYYNEDNYTPDSITYLIVTSGYNKSENHLLKTFKYKVTENGETHSISKKDYILMTIKEGGFAKFMKLNNVNSSCEWSHLNENTEWE
ncbi:hypothetical protein LQ356_02990 [Metamycoplasma faucium]|uniref:SGNH hydrolase-type esterase domain-containing protein n=1 Tax=Metamycoplasma faucium TaxID=56142 RepID=A0ABZ2TL60_9BACT